MKFINTSLLLLAVVAATNAGKTTRMTSGNRDNHDKNDNHDIRRRATTNKEGRYLVKYKKPNKNENKNNIHLMGSSPSSAGYRLQTDDPRLIMELPDDDVEVMTIETEDELRFWEDQDDVEYVEADSKIYLQGESTPWGIETVKALDVSDDRVSNQKVCIIDTGYDINHPDLPSSVTGTSQIKGESWKEDGYGHGTHVAGTIAAIGGNNEGVVGVNRNGEIKLHIVKVFNNDGDWTWASDLIKAVESCVAAGSTVVNMSLGGGEFLKAEKEAYDRVYNQNGVLLVASSGNGGSKDKSYPASYPSVISVGATDENNRIANFSQYNNQVDLCAPGVGVKSTVPGGKYKKFDGTSMSAPHVAGVAALIWSNFQDKSAQEIREALESSAQDLGSTGRDDKYGHGLVRADLAYNYLLSGGGGGSRPNPAPVPAPTPDGGNCVDSLSGWHDSDGEKFDCNWYGKKNRCEMHGDEYPNEGYTANEACCSCGGGTGGAGSRSMSGGKMSMMSQAQGQSKTSVTVSASTSTTDITCGCSSCTADVLERKISKNGHEWVIGDQIKWVMKNFEYDEIEACLLLCDDSYSDICNECAPSYCN